MMVLYHKPLFTHKGVFLAQMVTRCECLLPASTWIDRINIGIVERLADEHVADGGGRRFLESLVLEFEFLGGEIG